MDENLDSVCSLLRHLCLPWLHPWGALGPDWPCMDTDISPHSSNCRHKHSGGHFSQTSTSISQLISRNCFLDQVSPVILHYSYNLCNPKFLRRFGKICFFRHDLVIIFNMTQFSRLKPQTSMIDKNPLLSVANYIITTGLTALALR